MPAGVLELADETDSKSVAGNGVWVQVPPPAPKNGKHRKALAVFTFVFFQVSVLPADDVAFLKKLCYYTKW